MNSIDRKNTLLKQLADKTITMEQFLLACALWSLETACIVDYEVRTFPMPPREYQEYQNLPVKERYKMPESFFHQPVIKDYLRLRDRVFGQNWAEYSWLQEAKKHIPDDAEHLEQHKLLDNKIYEYKLWFKGSSKEAERVAEVFNGEVI